MERASLPFFTGLSGPRPITERLGFDLAAAALLAATLFLRHGRAKFAHALPRMEAEAFLRAFLIFVSLLLW